MDLLSGLLGGNWGLWSRWRLNGGGVGAVGWGGGVLGKSSHGQSGELCPNLPKCSFPPSKIDTDNKARFRYLDGYRFRLFDASICWAAVHAGTQFAFYDSSAPEKQLPIW